MTENPSSGCQVLVGTKGVSVEPPPPIDMRWNEATRLWVLTIGDQLHLESSSESVLRAHVQLALTYAVIHEQGEVEGSEGQRGEGTKEK